MHILSFPKKNYFLNPSLLGAGFHDGAAYVDGLELIQNMGIETLSADKEVFIPVGNISIFSDISGQCDAPHERLVLLIDNTIPPEESYIRRLRELKADGYKLAMRKLEVAKFEAYREIMLLLDYMLLDHKKSISVRLRFILARCIRISSFVQAILKVWKSMNS